MGFGAFLKKVLVGEPELLEPELLETDDELRELWHTREEFSPTSRYEIEVEFAVRGLPFPAERPTVNNLVVLPAALVDEEGAGDPDDASDGSAPTLKGDAHVLILDERSVAVCTPEGRAILCLFNSWLATSDQPVARPNAWPEGLELDALILWQHAAQDPQARAAYAAAWNIAEEAVHCLGGGELRTLRCGGVAVQDQGSWMAINQEHSRVLLGASVPLSAVATSFATHVVGGLAWPEDADMWPPIAEAWEALEEPVLKGVWVLSDVQGVATHLSRGLVQAMRRPVFLVASQLSIAVVAQPIIHAMRTGQEAGDPAEQETPALLEALSWLIFQGELELAEQLVTQVPEASQDGAFLLRQAQLAGARGERQRCEELLKAAVDAANPSGVAANTLAVQRQQAGDREAALALVRRAAEVLMTEVATNATEVEEVSVLKDPATIANLALSLWRSGDLDAAMSELQDGQLELSPWLRGMVETTLHEGDSDQDVPLQVGGATVASAWRMARWLSDSGDQDSKALAERILERLIVLEPNHAEAVGSLAALWAQRGRYSEAITLLDTALESLPSSAPLYLLRGECHFESGAYGDAATDWDQAMALSPEREWIASNRIIAWTRAGDASRAEGLRKHFSEERIGDVKLWRALHQLTSRSRL